MNIDARHFPQVTLEYNATLNLPMNEVLAQLSELIARDLPFAFIATGGLGEANADPEDHKKLSLWMKANKPQIVKTIKGHVQIVEDAAGQAAAREFVPTFIKFWGYPMLVAATAEEAQEKVGELLAA